MTITLQTNEFVRILKEAAIFAGTGPDIPLINAVHLEARGTSLVAIATDRFVLGASKAKLDEQPDESFTVALRLRQVRSIIQIAGAGRQCFSTVAVDADDKQVRIAFSSGETLTMGVEVERGQHRGWLKLLESTPGDDPAKSMAVNPQYMAKFGRVQGSQAYMQMHFFGHARPIRVTVGDSFVGMIMPVRMPDDVSMNWIVPEWVAPVAEKPSKAPARKRAAARKPRQPRKEPAA